MFAREVKVAKATDKASVPETIARLRSVLDGAGAAEVGRAVDESGRRVTSGDPLAGGLTTLEEVRAELGDLHAAVFRGIEKG